MPWLVNTSKQETKSTTTGENGDSMALPDPASNRRRRAPVSRGIPETLHLVNALGDASAINVLLRAKDRAVKYTNPITEVNDFDMLQMNRAQDALNTAFEYFEDIHKAEVHPAKYSAGPLHCLSCFRHQSELQDRSLESEGRSVTRAISVHFLQQQQQEEMETIEQRLLSAIHLPLNAAILNRLVTADSDSAVESRSEIAPRPDQHTIPDSRIVENEDAIGHESEMSLRRPKSRLAHYSDSVDPNDVSEDSSGFPDGKDALSGDDDPYQKGGEGEDQPLPLDNESQRDGNTYHDPSREGEGEGDGEGDDDKPRRSFPSSSSSSDSSDSESEEIERPPTRRRTSSPDRMGEFSDFSRSWSLALGEVGAQPTFSPSIQPHNIPLPVTDPLLIPLPPSSPSTSSYEYDDEHIYPFSEQAATNIQLIKAYFSLDPDTSFLDVRALVYSYTRMISDLDCISSFVASSWNEATIRGQVRRDEDDMYKMMNMRLLIQEIDWFCYPTPYPPSVAPDSVSSLETDDGEFAPFPPDSLDSPDGAETEAALFVVDEDAGSDEMEWDVDEPPSVEETQPEDASVPPNPSSSIPPQLPADAKNIRKGSPLRYEVLQHDDAAEDFS